MGLALDNAKRLYLDAIRDGRYVEAINTYAGDRYTQHSTPVRDGKDGFIEFFADFVKRNPVRDIDIVRAFQDGRYVFLHVVQNLNDGRFRYVTADIFDSDSDGKLIEHWDVITEMEDGHASGRSEIDGPTEPADLHATDANKELVARYVDDVLIPADFDRLDEFVAVELIQHNPFLADGIEAWRSFAVDDGLRYIERHRLVGCGNFVAVLCENEVHGKRHAVIDLYRVAAGRIAEAWVVAEEIAPPETWVNSGKF